MRSWNGMKIAWVACYINYISTWLWKKDNLQFQLKTPSSSFKAVLYHIALAKQSNIPNKIDLRKPYNPYKSWYGTDWHIELKKSYFLRWYSCVSNMIEHMVGKKNRVFRGTTYKNYFLFNHDDLSLMTEKETFTWMKEKGYGEMWILPEIDIFNRDPVLKHYRGCPPGNSPELCNIDSCLNKDFQKAVDWHVR